MAVVKGKPVLTRPVIVCTKYRGVFFGYAEDSSGSKVHLKDARMVIDAGTTRGIMQLAETGPTNTSIVSAKADIEVRKVMAVFEISEKAHKVWKEVK